MTAEEPVKSPEIQRISLSDLITGMEEGSGETTRTLIDSTRLQHAIESGAFTLDAFLEVYPSYVRSYYKDTEGTTNAGEKPSLRDRVVQAQLEARPNYLETENNIILTIEGDNEQKLISDLKEWFNEIHAIGIQLIGMRKEGKDTVNDYKEIPLSDEMLEEVVKNGGSPAFSLEYPNLVHNLSVKGIRKEGEKFVFESSWHFPGGEISGRVPACADLLSIIRVVNRFKGLGYATRQELAVSSEDTKYVTR